MALGVITARRIRSLVFIDDMTADRSNSIDSKVYSAMLYSLKCCKPDHTNK